MWWLAFAAFAFAALTRLDVLLRVWFSPSPSLSISEEEEEKEEEKFDSCILRPAILVTGAGSGIGLATVLRLISRSKVNGIRPLVLASVRSQESVQIFKQEIESKGLRTRALERVLPLHMDVADAFSVERGMANLSMILEDKKAVLCGVVSNAGAVVTCPVSSMKRSELSKMFETNAVGAVDVVNRSLPHLRVALRAGFRARIVYTSSLVSLVSLPLVGAYCASKHALRALTDAQRVELRYEPGIRVACVEPSNVQTGFIDANSAELRRRLADSASSNFDPGDTGGETSSSTILSSAQIHQSSLTDACLGFVELGSRLGARGPNQSVNAIEHALTARRDWDVREHYPVGPEVWLFPVVAAVCPAPLMDAVALVTIRAFAALVRFRSGRWQTADERQDKQA